MCSHSLYQEERLDGSHTGVKWRCPNIHDLVNILKKIRIELILDNVFDKRMTKLEDLSFVQLREECDCLNLDKKGKKVHNFDLFMDEISTHFIALHINKSTLF